MVEELQNSPDRYNKRGFLRYLCFFLILCILLTFIYTFHKVVDPVSYANLKGIQKEEKNSLDVLLLGASEIYADFSPTEAWKKYDFTSYSYGIAGIPGNLYPSMLREALKNQNPEVVVIEINGFLRGDDYYERYGKIHGWVDNIPWSENRLDSIQTVIPQKQQKEFYNLLETYHGNWKYPLKCLDTLVARIVMNCKTSNTLKGFATYTKHTGEDTYSDDKYFEYTAKSEQYLKDLIVTCKNLGLKKVLFTRFPHGRRITDTASMQKIGNLITSSGYEFVNYNEFGDSLGIQNATDYYNYDHLNVFGMKKFTTYFGKYLKEHYQIKSRQDDSLRADWAAASQQADRLLQIAEAETKQNSDARIFEGMLEFFYKL